MKKSQWNFIIDALLLLSMAVMTGKGLLLRYVLIPGRERHLVYGRNVELEMFGLDRHEWGTIHLYTGYVMAALVVLHIIMHWKMIVVIFRKFMSGKASRRAIGTAFTAICLLLVFFPFMIKPAVLERAMGARDGRGRRGWDQQENREPAPRVEERQIPGGEQEEQQAGGRPPGIKGRMTFGQVSEAYGVPVDYLARGLGIREKVSSRDRLGWLRQRYDFTMRDVEAVIEKYRNSK